jgi:hypothetical protein
MAASGPVHDSDRKFHRVSTYQATGMRQEVIRYA